MKPVVVCGERSVTAVLVSGGVAVWLVLEIVSLGVSSVVASCERVLKVGPVGSNVESLVVAVAVWGFVVSVLLSCEVVISVKLPVVSNVGSELG